MNINNGVSIIPTTLISFLGSVSECTRSWIQCSPLYWYQVYPTSQCWKNHSQYWMILAPSLSLWTPVQFYLWLFIKVGWCVCILSLYTFNCSANHLCLISYCHIYPMLLRYFCLIYLNFLPCTNFIISLNVAMASLSDRSGLLAIDF